MPTRASGTAVSGSSITSTDTTQGGGDSITTGSGNDTVLAGFGADTVTAGEGIGMAQVIYDQLTRSPSENRAATTGSPQPAPRVSAENSENSKSASGQNPVQASEEKGVAENE